MEISLVQRLPNTLHADWNISARTAGVVSGCRFDSHCRETVFVIREGVVMKTRGDEDKCNLTQQHNNTTR